MEVVDVATGALVAHARSAHPATTPPVSEQDPGAWWTALVECLGEVSSFADQVRAISVSGQQHGLVVLDGDDEPLRPAKLWNDTTSAPQSESLIAELGAETWSRIVGSVPGPSFTVTKLAWLAENEPELLERVRRVGLPHDYLNLKLSGNWVTDRGDASGTGYWSPADEHYVPSALEAAGVAVDGVELPRVAQPFETVGEVTNQALRALGFAAGVLVAPGSGDNMCGALGLGVGPGDVVVSLGTSGTAYAVSSTATQDSSGLVAGFADASGRFLPLVCTLNATKVVETIRSILCVEFRELDALALSSAQGANGVALVPYFDGERTPNLPLATGSVVGLRTSTVRGDLARAAFEGVTCGLLDGVDALAAAGVINDGRFFLIGGGSKSEAFCSTFASLSEREILVPDDDETVARGAAVQAACVLTGKKPEHFVELWDLGAGRSVQPETPSSVSAVAVRARYRDAASNS